MAKTDFRRCPIQGQIGQPIVGVIIVRVVTMVPLAGVAQRVVELRGLRDLAAARKTDAVCLIGEPEALDLSFILIDDKGEAR